MTEAELLRLADQCIEDLWVSCTCVVNYQYPKHPYEEWKKAKHEYEQKRRATV